MADLNKNIGSRIREFRRNKNISIEKMAENLNVSYSTYQRIETGETSSWVSHLESISNLLSVSVEEIVLDKDRIMENNNDQDCEVAIAQNIEIINILCKKIIEQFELRIKEKDEIIANQKINISDLKRLLDKV